MDGLRKERTVGRMRGEEGVMSMSVSVQMYLKRASERQRKGTDQGNEARAVCV
jgi:hypothetical protein